VNGRIVEAVIDAADRVCTICNVPHAEILARRAFTAGRVAERVLLRPVEAVDDPVEFISDVAVVRLSHHQLSDPRPAGSE
jgi:hypothetical protein